MELVKIFQPQIFTQEKLNQILPVIIRLTDAAKGRYEIFRKSASEFKSWWKRLSHFNGLGSTAGSGPCSLAKKKSSP